MKRDMWAKLFSLMSNTWIYVQLQIHQPIEDLEDRSILTTNTKFVKNKYSSGTKTT